MSPVSPPIEKRKMNDRAKSSGESTSIDPLYRVATQLKTYTPLGTATRKVMNEKTIRAVSLMPLVNMWCPQTK